MRAAIGPIDPTLDFQIARIVHRIEEGRVQAVAVVCIDSVNPLLEVEFIARFPAEILFALRRTLDFLIRSVELPRTNTGGEQLLRKVFVHSRGDIGFTRLSIHHA